MGNAYYNDGQFFNAEQNYLTALDATEIESVYIYLAWLKKWSF
jgi:hypothetical protein